MAVLTSITSDDARDLLAAYGVGEPRGVFGLAAGSVNSNFAVETQGGGRLFLRLYEERDLDGARAEAATVERLAQAGVPTPAPMRRRDGEIVSVVRGKPAALLPWRQGVMRCQAGVGADDARRVGEALARVHVAGAREPCDAGRFRFADLASRLDRVAASGHAVFAPMAPSLRARLERAHAAREPSLPRGLTHGDLFRDNVLWDERGRIAALLDFESACEDSYAYDLAVTVLAWCVGDRLEPGLARAMCEGYETVRRLSDDERRGLHAEACFAALRFTVTRITDYGMRPAGPGPRVVKDWRRFFGRLEELESLGPEGLRAALAT